MRYIALFLILVGASLTMPMVKVSGGDDRVQAAFITALTESVEIQALAENHAVGPAPMPYRAPDRAPAILALAVYKPDALPDSFLNAGVFIAPPEMAVPDRVADPVVTAEATEAIPPAALDTRAVAADVLNMRSGPSSRFPVVGALNRGEQAIVIGEADGGWLPVRNGEGDVEGWVFSRYLTPVDDA